MDILTKKIVIFVRQTHGHVLKKYGHLAGKLNTLALFLSIAIGSDGPGIAHSNQF
jgi:hypothetical protein